MLVPVGKCVLQVQRCLRSHPKTLYAAPWGRDSLQIDSLRTPQKTSFWLLSDPVPSKDMDNDGWRSTPRVDLTVSHHKYGMEGRNVWRVAKANRTNFK